MPAAIRITREEHTSIQLRLSASRCKDSAAPRRMLALALILDGQSFTAAAEAAGMNRQTLRNWVHCYNEHGVDGLTDSWGGGRKALLNTPQMNRLTQPAPRLSQNPVYMPIDKGRASVPHEPLPLPLLDGIDDRPGKPAVSMCARRERRNSLRLYRNHPWARISERPSQC